MTAFQRTLGLAGAIAITAACGSAAAPAPALEPPTLHAGFHGLRVRPCRLETPEESIPRSGMTVVPSSTPPASRLRAVAGPSHGSGGASAKAALPDGRGRPATAMFSFTVNGTPSIGPAGSAARHRASLARAAARAPGASSR